MAYLVIVVPPENVNGDSRVTEIIEAIEKVMDSYRIPVHIEVMA